jgi:hypothetical protein
MLFWGWFCKLCWVQTPLYGFLNQHCWSCYSAVVDVLVLSTWCNSTVVDVSALSLMCQHCRHDGTSLFLMCQRCQRDATVLWLSNSAVIDVTALSMWSSSAVDHAPVLSIMCQHCQSCDSTVNRVPVPPLMWLHCWHDATAPSIMLSHAQQLCCAIDNKVIQRTGSLPNWQWWCCNCVSWLPFICAYK